MSSARRGNGNKQQDSIKPLVSISKKINAKSHTKHTKIKWPPPCFSFPPHFASLFLDCVWHQKHFENLQGKFLSLSPATERPKMRFVFKREQEEEEKSTGDDEKTGRVYCVMIFTMGNGVEKKKKGIRVNSHGRRRHMERETHTHTDACVFLFSVWQSESVLLYRRELIPLPPLLLLSRKGMIINRPLESTGREELGSTWYNRMQKSNPCALLSFIYTLAVDAISSAV